MTTYKTNNNSTNIDLTVVVVNYNVRPFLQLCLHSATQACKLISAEIIVVDNASSDESEAMVQKHFPEVSFVANKVNVGFAKANNQAIRMAKGRYVLLLNPDTIVPETAFAEMVTYLDGNPTVGSLGTRMVDGAGRYLPESKRGIPTPWASFCKMSKLSTFFPKIKSFNHYYFGWIDQHEVADVEILAGAVMCLRTSVLDKVGLLDETFFMYGEDIDLSYRIIKEGYRNVYLGTTTIIHFKGESTKGFSWNYYRNFFGAMDIFRRKHFNHRGEAISKYFIQAGILFFAMLKISRKLFSKSDSSFKENNYQCTLFSSDFDTTKHKVSNVLKHWEVISPEEAIKSSVPAVWLFDKTIAYGDRLNKMAKAKHVKGIFHEVPFSNEIIASHLSTGNGEIIML